MTQAARNFVSDGQSGLSSAIKGLLSLNPSLYLDEKYKVVYRDAADRAQRVAVISGGGSGHEPAHAGFVGHGMLDAAVCGAVFASPNAAQIEAGLGRIQSPKGILIIVKNYTGDKLNFTLAAERFRLASGVPVRLVIVADDVSIGRTRSALVGRRGLAGTVLVHKIAGAASIAGLDLDSIVAAAESVMSHMGTIGVGLDGCHVPGQANESRLADDEVEIGIGIHNEPGSRRIKPRPNLDTLIKSMLSNLLDDDPDRNYLTGTPRAEDHSVVLQINNLGGLSFFELLAITRQVISHLETGYGIRPVRVYSGNSKIFQDILEAIHKSVVAAEPEITRNDAILGDGDCGTTLVEGSNSLIQALQQKQIDTGSLSHGILKIAELISLSMGGTSGALYSVFMTGLASGIVTTVGDNDLSIASLSVALRQALRSLEQVTAAREGDRTMMDALSPFVRVFSDKASDKGRTTLEVIEGGLAAAKQGCETTRELESRFGRSTYVGAADDQGTTAGIADPGAMGIVAIISGVLQAIRQNYRV
ncbi:Dihydroxyacetone kinase 2 [Fusarium falciforme]|nr:Dihydroxyacetone kinase 2 [Fusarium falciforme]